MHHFFVHPECLRQDPIALQGGLAHQLHRVLRLQAGTHIVLLDNSGWAYEVQLSSVSPAQVTACLVSRWQPQTEPGLRLVLYQALTKEHKLDWVLQKGTELGVAAFVPLLTERSLIPSGTRLSPSRLPRWQQIVTEAAEQSGRAHIPQVLPVQTLEHACATWAEEGLTLIACPIAEARPLGDILEWGNSAGEGLRIRPVEIRLLIGPEGGFAPHEVERARQAGAVPISLGPRILRTETAGMVALSAILYAFGEMGGTGQDPPSGHRSSLSGASAKNLR